MPSKANGRIFYILILKKWEIMVVFLWVRREDVNMSVFIYIKKITKEKN